MWALLIVVFFMGGSSTSQTITNFKTEQSCNVAANNVTSQSGGFGLNYRTTCIKVQ